MKIPPLPNSDAVMDEWSSATIEPHDFLAPTPMNLDTVYRPRSVPYRDETPRVQCAKCWSWLDLGRGMMHNETLSRIARIHCEICEGDAAETLKKIEAIYAESPERITGPRKFIVGCREGSELGR